MNRQYIIEITMNEKKTNKVNTGYRPHLALPNSDELLGVQFVNFIDEVITNQPTLAVIETMYDIDYSSLQVNTIFDIREGRNIVGKGIIKEII
jgi:hypothetical protein